MTRAEMRRRAKGLAKMNKTINFKTDRGTVVQLSTNDVQRLVNLKEEIVNNMRIDIMNESADVAFCLLLCMPLVAIKDWLGFGKKRINEFYKRIMSHYNAYNDGYVKLSDMMKILYEETDFKKNFKVDENLIKNWDKLIEHEESEEDDKI